MDQERMIILQMVADGQISAEEGVRLLKALGQEPVDELEDVFGFPTGASFDSFAADFTLPIPPPGWPSGRIFEWVAEFGESDFDADFDFNAVPGDFI